MGDGYARELRFDGPAVARPTRFVRRRVRRLLRVLELQRAIHDPDRQQPVCPHCGKGHFMQLGHGYRCFVCGSLFAAPVRRAPACRMCEEAPT